MIKPTSEELRNSYYLTVSDRDAGEYIASNVGGLNSLRRWAQMFVQITKSGVIAIFILYLSEYLDMFPVIAITVISAVIASVLIAVFIANFIVTTSKAWESLDDKQKSWWGF